MSTLFNFSQAPYNSLSNAERERFIAATDIQFFASGSILLAAQSEVDALYVIHKGLIAEEDHGEVLTVYSDLDTLNGKALLSAQTAVQFIALEDSLVFRTERELILELTSSNPRFGAFFYQDVAARLATLAHQSPEEGELQALLLAPVQDALFHPLKWLNENASVLDAARAMREQRCTSVLIQAERGAGIFTQSDLRDFVIAGHDAATAKVADHANYQLHGVKDDAPLHAAMLLMSRHTISRAIVYHEDAIVGVLEQVDLLAFLTQHSHLIQNQIERASTLTELGTAWAKTAHLIQLQHKQGVKVTLIADTMRELHRQLLAQTFRLIAPAVIIENVCLLCMGSEGRGEQILSTDQDNALIIADGFEHPDLERVCEQFNQAQLQFGYPACPGKIMVNNPYWRRSVSEFKVLFNEWIAQCHPSNMLNLAIWVDAYPVIGNKALFAQLRSYLHADIAQNDSLLGHFASSIEQFETPLGFFSQLRSKGGQLDVKKGGIFTLVHGIRSLSLKAGLIQRNTYQRIDALIQRGALSPEVGRDVAESLAYLHSLQLKYGLQKIQMGKPLDHFIDITQLTTLERDLLKDTLAVVKRFKQMIAHQFKLHAL